MESVNNIRTSVQSYMKAKDFNQVVNHVRQNTNGYSYVTFINTANEAENVYFSKNASAKFAQGDAIVKGFFDNIEVGEYPNAAGELRTKLTLKGESMRVDANDLF